MDTEVKYILETIAKAGYEVAIVGGAVRDLLEKKGVSDWDLTTNAKPQEILKLFKKSFYNNRFGTVSIFAGEKTVEITTYRKEHSYSDRRHPDVISWGKTLEEDLARRDFTINAMALKIENGKLKMEKDNSQFSTLNSKLTLVDPYFGQEDLKRKIIKTVGDPVKRFSEDALRLLRAIRFATTLGFDIEEKTLKAIKKESDLLFEISGERICNELFKILESDDGARGILLVRDCGLLRVILPELDLCFSVEQKSPERHHIYDVGTHCVMSLKHCPSKDKIVRLAALIHDIGKAKVAKVTEEGVRTFYNHEVFGGRMALEVANRLHFSKQMREKLFRLVRWHLFSVGENQTDRALRRFIRNIGVENIEDMMDLRIGDRLGGGLQQPESWRLKLFRKRLGEVMKKPFRVTDLKINGHDVMTILNLKPGPAIGDVLQKLFDEVESDPKKNVREYLLKRLKELNP